MGMAYVSVSTLRTWASTSPGSVRTQPGPGALDFSQGSSALVLSVYATRTADTPKYALRYPDCGVVEETVSYGLFDH
ncbi:hypothetical protein PG996_001841 [Apiospora saccharicola]|uniref:Uncharacterized protein n=1 Tax=Apiospora saccharicola TaxID=335842 RepID=A0ABR1WKP3_9PEZI